MTRISRSGPLLLISGIVFALLGLVLAAGGVYLLMLAARSITCSRAWGLPSPEPC